MKQDTVDAVLSHNPVIAEDSTSWIFLSSPCQVWPTMSKSLATVRAVSPAPPCVYESSNCFSGKAQPSEPEAPSRSHGLSCSVETETVETGFVPGRTLQCCVQTRVYKVGEL